jgi:hypothetical protein
MDGGDHHDGPAQGDQRGSSGEEQALMEADPPKSVAPKASLRTRRISIIFSAASAAR